jgi:protein ImuB
MQLELAAGPAAAAPLAPAPRVLALVVPELPLQRVLRAREAAGAAARGPLAVERDGQVVACNAEARARGVAAGEALGAARAACGELEVVPADVREERAALTGLAEALLGLAPQVEVAEPDALLLDASAAHLVAAAGEEPETALAARAVAVAASLGLRCRTAIADGRGPARALARAARSETARAAPGEGGAALAPLGLAALELAPALWVRLTALGLRSAGDLARLPRETLAHRFGAPGLAAWRLARGDDPSPLVPWSPERLPEERLELEAPVENLEALLFGLKRLSDRLAARLAGRGLGATRLALGLRLDPAGDERLEVALAAPTSAASRWLLVLRERLAGLRLPGPVAGATLAVAAAAAAPLEQLGLEDRPAQLTALDAVLTRLAARLGDGGVCTAEPVARHRPERAWRRTAFASRRKAGARPAPAEGEPEGGGGCDAAAPPAAALVRPTRLLGRPEPLVALGEGGRVAAVRLGGRTLRVLSLSPAERLAGEWWSEPFDRDYHRARLEGLGDCWIFRDAADGRLWLHGFFD